MKNKSVTIWVIAIAAMLVLLSWAQDGQAGIIIQDKQSGGHQILYFSPIGQTFTAEDSHILFIGFKVEGWGQKVEPIALTVELFEGVGTGGLSLGSAPITGLTPGFSGFFDADFNSVTLTVGQVYTAIVSSTTAGAGVGTFFWGGYTGAPDPYTGGDMIFLGEVNDNGDLMFRVIPDQFVLWDDEQLIVNSSHSMGTLFDRSRATIVTGGWMGFLYAHDSSSVDMSGGDIRNLYAYNFSDVDISGGSIGNSLYAYDSSTVDISGGSVSNLYAYDSSTVDMTGGSVSKLYASSTVNISGGSVDSYLYAYSVVDISGGSVSSLCAYGSSVVAISGGSVSKLYAYSVVTFYGRDFLASGGLVLDGNRVLGTGVLSGQWMDRTPWMVNILNNPSTATILAIFGSPGAFCVEYPTMDFNGDCKVDFSDLAIFLNHWLECTLDPPSACWE
jgi:hypothetical protein